MFEELKKCFTRITILKWLTGFLLTSGFAVFLKVGSAVNTTGQDFGMNLILNTAGFEFFVFLFLFLLLLLFLPYPKFKMFFQKILVQSREKDKKKEKEKVIQFLKENKDEIISALELNKSA